MKLGDFREITIHDTEFRGDEGDIPTVVCVVSKELRSGNVFRLWCDGDATPRRPPFATGPNVLSVAYVAAAEIRSFLSLKWPTAGPWLDLYVEFRRRTNGLTAQRGLVDALNWYRLPGIDASQKDYWRKRTLKGPPYSNQEIDGLLDYCAGDVFGTERLFRHMVSPDQDLSLALFDGEYVGAVALMENRGVPIDPVYQCMKERWRDLQLAVIGRVNETFPVFDKWHFRTARFLEVLERRGWLQGWPTLESGQIALDDGTFKEQTELHPPLAPLRQTRQMLSELRTPKLAVGRDWRNRTPLWPYSTITGRCAPSTTKFIFAMPKLMRGLIRPGPDTAIGYSDYKSQEIGIASALGKDLNLQAAYNSPDSYLEFARMAKAIPPNPTKDDTERIRRIYKTAMLGTNYGQGPTGLAPKVGITLNEAEDALRLHKRLFDSYWQWAEAASDYYQLHGVIRAALGWPFYLSDRASLRSLLNWPAQSNGSEMLRVAVVYASREGVQIIATVHDAIVFQAPASEIDHARCLTERAMIHASEIVLDGFPLRVETQIVRPGDRFRDKDGETMWQWMMEALRGLGVSA